VTEGQDIGRRTVDHLRGLPGQNISVFRPNSPARWPPPPSGTVSVSSPPMLEHLGLPGLKQFGDLGRSPGAIRRDFAQTPRV